MCCSTVRHCFTNCRVISPLFMWILTLTYSHIHMNTCPCKTPIYSQIYIYPCKTSTHTDLKSHFPMLMRNWMLPCFLDNNRRERDSDAREYYAGLRREWDFHMNESNILHDDLVQLKVLLVNFISPTLPRQNMDQYQHVVVKIKKKGEQSYATP